MFHTIRSPQLHSTKSTVHIHLGDTPWICASSLPSDLAKNASVNNFQKVHLVDIFIHCHRQDIMSEENVSVSIESTDKSLGQVAEATAMLVVYDGKIDGLHLPKFLKAAMTNNVP